MDSQFANPFSTRFVRPGEIDYCFDIAQCQVDRSTQLATIIESIAQSRCSLIVGPHGTGKSTLIETLLPSLRNQFDAVEIAQLHATPDRRWRDRWRQERRNRKQAANALERLPTARASADLSGDGLLIVDGFEQLSRFARYQMVQAAKRCGNALLVTAHAEIRGFQSVYQTRVRPKVLERLTVGLVAESPESLQEHVQAQLDQCDLSEVRNVRDFWFDLYDGVADLHASDQCNSNQPDGCIGLTDRLS